MMEMTSQVDWQIALSDPSGSRQAKPRTTGKTMVIDKGLGLHAFEDLIMTSQAHIDIIKIGFGTAPLYPTSVLQQKLTLAKQHQIEVLPGGTFLEVAIQQDEIRHFMDTIAQLGFTAMEVSDGTIELDRADRNELIREGIERGFTVFTEYGKKCWGSSIDMESFIEACEIDMSCGAKLVTVEGRESGTGVGFYDARGQARDDDILEVINRLSHPELLLWETPLKHQQAQFITLIGPQVNLGNIAPEDVLSVEALRRGLRSDTLKLARKF